MTDEIPAPVSPRWGSTTKMVVGLTIIAIVAALLIQFRTIIGPLLLAFILAYLIYPVSMKVSQLTRLSWRAVVNLIFLLLVVIYLGSITVTGLTVVQQLQSLINFVGLQITDLPQWAASLSTQVFRLGPFEFNMEQFDLQTLSRQLLSVVQPLLGRMVFNQHVCHERGGYPGVELFHHIGIVFFAGRCRPVSRRAGSHRGAWL